MTRTAISPRLAIRTRENGGMASYGYKIWDVRRHAELDSTNRLAADLARAGAPEGVVVVADHQTAGRGRLGRTWEAPPGSSLLMTVVLRPALDAGRLHLATSGRSSSDASVSSRMRSRVTPARHPADSGGVRTRSEEHTSELQSPYDL